MGKYRSTRYCRNEGNGCLDDIVLFKSHCQVLSRNKAPIYEGVYNALILPLNLMRNLSTNGQFEIKHAHFKKQAFIFFKIVS
jgi:hypothetical protein